MEKRKNCPDSPKEFPDTLETIRARIREKHRMEREAMSTAEVAEKSAEICDRLPKEPWYADCPVIYGYYPIRNEVDCRSFLEHALLDKKIVALPKMTEKMSEYTENDGKASKFMDFYRISSLEEVTCGKFHVMEPADTCPRVTESHAVVLVPGVVFGRDGNRYGFGQGYYDRYFARFPGLYRIGIAYENQLEDTLAVLSTDVRMNAVCTEEKMIYF